MRQNTKRGFTVIELLIVVGIIAILATLLIASLTSAKQKAQDKAIVANMLTIRSQAQLYYDGAGGQSYGPVQSYPVSNDCTLGLYSADSVIAQTIAKLKQDRGTDLVACFSTPTTYAIVTKLNFVNGYFCLDSVNTGRVIDGNSNAAWNGVYGPGAQLNASTKTATVDTNTALCNSQFQ